MIAILCHIQNTQYTAGQHMNDEREENNKTDPKVLDNLAFM